MTREQVEKALKGVKAANLRETIAKDDSFTMRVSKVDKEHLKRTAKALNLTVTEYLIACHKVVAGRLGMK